MANSDRASRIARRSLRIFWVFGTALFGGSLILVTFLQLAYGGMDWTVFAAAIVGVVVVHVLYAYRMRKMRTSGK